MEWGDVWSVDGFYYKIQVRGNALIPVAYMLSFTKFIEFKYKKISRIILLSGIIFAGNFAFMITTALFHIFLFFDINSKKKIRKKIVLFTVISGITFFPGYFYTKSVLETKDNSLGARKDQTTVLLTDLSNTSVFLVGGLGNTINTTTA
jgi:hypothetical protein